MSGKYEVVIGLEVHAELKTKTKIFCSCPTTFGGEPNTHVCPICLGLPGTLPVFNKKVLEYAVKAGLALNCKINTYSKFDRKNYYYPDLSKNFQTSQYDLPIAKDGYLDLEVEGRTKRVRINRVHMEEDAGKLVHSGSTISSSSSSLVDYNRAGVPLIEIVSEPDISSPEEARAYMELLKSVLEYTEVSDCKMEEGSLRCDANISIRPEGSTKLGTKTEIKNMNSFRALQKALEYEIQRQIQIVEDGGTIVQETRSWDEIQGITVSMRSKEEAHDYRYFPEPDLAPIIIDEKWLEKIRASIPELPQVRKKRLMENLGLSAYDAGVITSSRQLADFFDATVKEYGGDAKIVANWVMGELLRLLNASDQSITNSPIQPKALADLLKLVDKGTISGKIAKQVFEEMFTSGKSADTIVKEKGLVQISDEGVILSIVEKVIDANPQSVEDYKNGKEKAIGFLVGQVMRETKGKANPGLVNKLLKEKLAKL